MDPEKNIFDEFLFDSIYSAFFNNKFQKVFWIPDADIETENFELT